MKKTTIILTFILFSISLFSQETKNSKMNIGISFGSSIPIGDFGNSDTQNSNAGLARLGYNINLSAKFNLTQNIGLVGIYTINSNKLNEKAFEDEIRLQFPTLGISINTGDYKSSGILVGLFFKTPMNNLLSFESRALVGYSTSQSPEINLRFSDGTQIITGTILKDDAKSISLRLGAGLIYDLSNNLALSLNVDYYYTEPEFELVTISEFSPTTTSTNKQKFTILNTSLGIEYKF